LQITQITEYAEWWNDGIVESQVTLSEGVAVCSHDRVEGPYFDALTEFIPPWRDRSLILRLVAVKRHSLRMGIILKKCC
jgi:hypothetical protein